MAQTKTDAPTIDELLTELAALDDPKIRAVNEKHGDDHGVNLSALRAVAKRVKTQHELAQQLWATGDTAARLLALLICARRRSPPTNSTRWSVRPAPRRCTTGS